MTMLRRRDFTRFAAAVAAATAVPRGLVHAQAPPIKVGFSMSVTGGLAAAGKSALIATEIWRNGVNARGGLLGRKVEIVTYDDQSNAALVPAIYTKLLDVDKVDLLLSGYATNQIAPAMPIAIQRRKLLLALHGLGNNEETKYDRFFHVVPYGQNPKRDWLRGFVDLVDLVEPRPKTVGFITADAEFAQNSIAGVRKLFEAKGLRTAYDQSYPMSLIDMSSLVRGAKAADPDVLVLFTYPQHSTAVIRSVSEIGLGPSLKLAGGGMVGMQFATLLQSLGPSLNGFVTFHFYVPEPTVESGAMKDFLALYQPEAVKQGADPLGFYIPTFAYARLQVLESAILATKSIDDGALADYMRRTTFDTVVGKVRFGLNGERADGNAIFVQYQGIKGNDLNQFKGPGRQVIVSPRAVASGKLITPFAAARK